VRIYLVRYLVTILGHSSIVLKLHLYGVIEQHVGYLACALHNHARNFEMYA